MEKKEITYTPEFYEVLKCCKKNSLFLGEGTPTAKILIVGKECGLSNEKKARLNNKKGKNLENEILQISKEEAESNLFRLENNYRLPKDVNKNPTWQNYQTLVNKITGKNKTGWGDFLEDSFITEFSQIQLPNSKFLINNGLSDEIRKKSIEQRKKIFSLPFFRSFPIVILACGHYPTNDFFKDYNYRFDIEETFNVKWVKPEDYPAQKATRAIEKNGKYPVCWYNIHYNKDYATNDKSRIVIHTRQFSRIFNPQLLTEIANEIHPLWETIGR